MALSGPGSPRTQPQPETGMPDDPLELGPHVLPADCNCRMGEIETVLIVDDNDLVRTLVCAQVQSAGYRVLEAESPAAALELARCCGNVDVVLTDLAMPGGGGVALVAALQNRHPALRALFMSGFTDARVPGSFIAKPFSAAELLDALRRLLEENDLAVALGA